MQNFEDIKIDRYQILEPLGQGGMALVYKALDLDLERTVAVKFIRRDAVPPRLLAKTLLRFESEAKALAILAHPHIVPVYDYGFFNEEPYLVMEYLPGGTLTGRMDHIMPIEEALELLLPIADALAYAHEQGIVHRDVKPANILFRQDAAPVLTDFGIAKVFRDEENYHLTTTGIGIGTPGYMAPEQWYGKVSPKIDQYALGVIFYEMISGRQPFIPDPSVDMAAGQVEIPASLLNENPAGFAPAVTTVLSKAMALNPAERYADMQSFQTAISDLPSALAAPAQTGQIVNHKRRVLIPGVMLLVLLLSAGAWWLWGRLQTGNAAALRGQEQTLPAGTSAADTGTLPGTPLPTLTLTSTPTQTPDAMFATVAAIATQKARQPSPTSTPTLQMPPFSGSLDLPELPFLEYYEVTFNTLLIDQQRAFDPQEWNWWGAVYGDFAIANGTLAFKLNESFPYLSRAETTLEEGRAVLTLVQAEPGTQAVLMAEKGTFDTTLFTTWESYLNYGGALKCAMYPYVGPLAAETIRDTWYYVYLEPRDTEGYVRMWEYDNPENYAECSMLIPDDASWRFRFTGTTGRLYIKGYWELNTR